MTVHINNDPASGQHPNDDSFKSIHADKGALTEINQIRDLWRLLAHSVSRHHSAFAAIGKAIRDPDSLSLGRFTHLFEKYDSDENHFHYQADKALEAILARAESPEAASEVTAPWRCVHELELVTACTRRFWQLAIQEKEGTFTFQAEARQVVASLLQRLEELVYWTLEALRLHYASMPRQQAREAFRIIGKDAEVALSLFEKAVLDSKRKRESHKIDDSKEIPAEVAFFDFVSLADTVRGHFVNLSNLATQGFTA